MFVLCSIVCYMFGCIHLMYSMLHTDCVRVMQKKPNKNKTGEDTAQQDAIVTVPITKGKTSPTKGGM